MLVVLISILIRVVPTLYTNNVFSNDSWPLLHASNYVLLHPNEKIFSLSREFEHHVLYPVAIVESALYVLITGTSVDVFYKLVGVVLLTLAMALSAYILAKYLSYSYKASILSTLALTLVPWFTTYTSAYLKEFYAHALLLLLIYVVAKMRKPCGGFLALLLIISTALVFSHPLTTLMAVAILASWFFVNLVHFALWRHRLTVSYSMAIASVTVLLMHLVHSLVLAREFVVINAEDVAMLVLYAGGIYGCYVLLGKASSILIVPAFVLSTIAILKVITVPLAYTAFFFIAPPVLLLSMGSEDISGDSDASRLATSALLVVAVIFVFISTYMAELLSVLHRVLNYVIYAAVPVAALLAERYGRLWSILSGVLLALSILVAITVAAGANPYTFYWRYTDHDTMLTAFLEEHTELSVFGDPKYSQASRAVNSIPVHVLRNLCTFGEGALVASRDDLKYGVPLSPVDFFKLDDSVLLCRSRVFDSGYVYVFA